MLSVLIPTFNYNVYPLVTELNKQCLACGIEFEIIVLDDCSNEIETENDKINSLANSSFHILTKNIGRCSIRNLLAQKANFENLLFLDADTIPINSNFISNYINEIDDEEKVVYGGIQYKKKKPNKTYLLRWVYGNSREALSVIKRKENPYISFLSMSFLIKKSILRKVSFNETVLRYGHEDTLFSFDLKKNNILIDHIENPVYHLIHENSTVFLQKSEEALLGLKQLIDSNLLQFDYIKINRIYHKLKQSGTVKIYLFFYQTFKSIIKKNLASKNPSLFLFDLYRLGYFCTINSN